MTKHKVLKVVKRRVIMTPTTVFTLLLECGHEQRYTMEGRLQSVLAPQRSPCFKCDRGY